MSGVGASTNPTMAGSKTLTPWLLVGLLVGSLVPRLAHACCGALKRPPAIDLPVGPAPTNTLVWRMRGVGQAWDELGVRDLATGEATAMTHAVIVAGNRTLHVYRPVRELRPRSRYEVVAADGQEVTPPQHFETTAGPDLVPPVLPVLGAVRPLVDPPNVGRSTGPMRSVVFEVQSAAPIVVVDRSRTTQLEGTSGATALVGLPTDRWYLGAFPCRPSNWLGARRGTVLSLRAGAFDLAGNFSGFGADTMTNLGPPGPPRFPFLSPARRMPWEREAWERMPWDSMPWEPPKVAEEDVLDFGDSRRRALPGGEMLVPLLVLAFGLGLATRRWR